MMAEESTRSTRVEFTARGKPEWRKMLEVIALVFFDSLVCTDSI